MPWLIAAQVAADAEPTPSVRNEAEARSAVVNALSAAGFFADVRNGHEVPLRCSPLLLALSGRYGLYIGNVV